MTISLETFSKKRVLTELLSYFVFGAFSEGFQTAQDGLKRSPKGSQEALKMPPHGAQEGAIRPNMAPIITQSGPQDPRSSCIRARKEVEENEQEGEEREEEGEEGEEEGDTGEEDD